MKNCVIFDSKFEIVHVQFMYQYFFLIFSLIEKNMANSKWEYVKNFELDDTLLPGVFMVVRVDGRGFTKFCIEHNLEKPLDDRMIRLMANCGKVVMEKFDEMVIGFGESDEFSFVFKKDSNTFNRRRDKIVSTVASLFTAAFVMGWPQFFPGIEMKIIPSFDTRVVLYPSEEVVRDYLSWRQADTHINCLYNYTLRTLERSGIDSTTATEMLRGTFSADKNEILFKHGINYNFLPASHRKGTLIVRDKRLVIRHDDLIEDKNWNKIKKLLK